MATRRVTNNAGRGKKDPSKLVCCKDCFWSNLIQYENNPILAECRQKPNYYSEKFPYDRDVASALKYCAMHKYQDESEKFVQHRVSVRQHPMAAYAKSQTTNEDNGSKVA